MLDVILCIIAMILGNHGHVAISIWIVAVVALHMSIVHGNKAIYHEMISDYPTKDRIKPKRVKFMFKFSYDSIPKELYFSELCKSVGWAIYTFAAILTLGVGQKKIASIFGLVYFVTVYMISFICIWIMHRKCFFSRYKILNIQNLKYYILGMPGPPPKRIGKCKILQVDKKKKHVKHVTVLVMETGKVIQKVVLQGEKIDTNYTYNLFEICHVYYIA